MNVSVIVSSLKRTERLLECLQHIDRDGLIAHKGEIILVFTNGDKETAAVMESFASQSPIKTLVVNSRIPGLSAARNTGIRASNGDLLIFIDDDCHMHSGYIQKLVAEMNSRKYAYGGGKAIHKYANGHTNDRHCTTRREIPPGTILSVGHIQGSNMFFMRSVFENIGYFREDLGAGSNAVFGGEDAEMVARASLAGYTGITLPEVIVDHHQPKPWSDELNKKHANYESGRGTFYAHLMTQGVQNAWNLWRNDWSNRPPHLSRRDLERLHRELHAAAEYVKYYLNENGVMRRPNDKEFL